MGEPIWTTFEARIPNTWTSHDLVGPLEATTWDGDTFVDVTDGVTFIRRCGLANYGLAADGYETIFEWCHQRRVPFIATDEPIPGCSGQIQVCDGTNLIEGSYDGDRVVLAEHTYDRIVDGGDEDFATVDDYFAKLGVRISELSIEHLALWPPPDPDVLEDDPE